jgi:hypothetical protein
MRRESTITGYLMLTWITIFLNIGLVSLSQDEMAGVPFQNDELILKMPEAGLKLTMTDTILPTICNSGLGLLHNECISIQDNGKDFKHGFNGGRNSSVIPEGFTESELVILKNWQHVMDEQYHYELKQQIRREKYDIGLGEIIKGFYMKPVF